MNFSLNMAYLETMSLAAMRITAFLFLAPPFSYSGFPKRIKVMFGVALSLVVAPNATGVPAASLDTGPFITALVSQIVIGALLGFLVNIVFSAVQSAGSIIDLFGGFQLAQAFDPAMNVNGAQITKLMQMTALALLFVSGGAELVLRGLVRTFTALPVTGAVKAGWGAMLPKLLSEMFLAAVQIAGPLVVVLFLTDVGLGLLTRVAPALNAFQLGFPLKILVTLLLAGTIFIGLPNLVDTLTQDALNLMAGVKS